MTPLDTSQEKRAARLLEWSQLLEEVGDHAALTRARDEILNLTPLTDPGALSAVWDHVAELTVLLESGDDLPLASSLDLEEVLGASARARGPLDPDILAGVGAAAVALADLRDRVGEWEERLPRTQELLRDTAETRGVGEHLLAALEPDGRIRDGASPSLRGLRRALEAAGSRVRDTAQKEMARARGADWSTGDALVLRNDHYCVPVRSGSRKRMPGVVHDRSASGNTMFVEPMAVVEAASELSEAQLSVAEEERRIVIALNEQLKPHADGLLDLYGRAVRLDGVRARARWGRRRGGRIPELLLAPERRWVLPGFRHPLLWTSLERDGHEDQLVPLWLEVSTEDRVLLVSGPNAGGKTVALKAVGLAQFMAQSAIPLPCEDAGTAPVLSICDRVLLDLGDEQSIADALSSFSAHLSHVRDILEQATDQSLVLLDELGGGTDPQEGVALARAVIEYLAHRGIRTLTTTHYGQLKVLAQEIPGIRNASMAYDQEALVPRFALVLDVPGSSHALSIARRLGLLPSVLARARELVGEESLDLTAILAEMERERDRARAARDEAEALRDRHLAAQKHYETLHGQLRDRRREVLQTAEREAEGIVRNARRKIERLLASIRESGAGEEAKDQAATARREVDAVAERLREQRERREAPAASSFAPRVGEPARHRGLGKVGQVVKLRSGKATLDLAGRRVVASIEELEDPRGETAPPVVQEGLVRTQVEPAAARGGSSRVDVRGQDVIEAWAAVDRALDRCLVGGITVLEVIHGKGTGALRAALTQRLASDSRVRETSLGGEGRFDDGLTIVRM